MFSEHVTGKWYRDKAQELQEATPYPFIFTEMVTDAFHYILDIIEEGEQFKSPWVDVVVMQEDEFMNITIHLCPDGSIELFDISSLGRL